MAGNPEIHDLLAKLVAYPDGGTRAALDRCRALVPAMIGDAGEALARFVEQTEPMSLEELQEIYTQAFDLNPACSLEIGWQLYGENYARGEFLVAMRQTLRRLEVPESTELPDHLTHVLAALGRMSDHEAAAFGAECLFPALEKMLGGLDRKAIPFAWVLEAIRGLFRTASSVPDRETPGPWSLPVIDPSEEVCHG